MKHNQVSDMSIVHLLSVGPASAPTTPTPAGGIPPLSSAGSTQRLSITNHINTVDGYGQFVSF